MPSLETVLQAQIDMHKMSLENRGGTAQLHIQNHSLLLIYQEAAKKFPGVFIEPVNFLDSSGLVEAIKITSLKSSDLTPFLSLLSQLLA